MKRLSIRLPEWIYQILITEAEKRGTSMNGLISQVCYDFSETINNQKQQMGE